MTKQELIYDINDRFRFGLTSMRKGLLPYEVELIYDVYPELSKTYIDSVLNGYKYGQFKAKAPKKAGEVYSPPGGFARGIKSGSIIM